MTQVEAQVRGHSALDQPATTAVKLASAIADLAWMAAIALLTPVLHPWVAPILLGVAWGLRALIQRRLGASPGQILWKLRSRDATGRKHRPVLQKESLEGLAGLSAIILTALLWAAPAALWIRNIVRSPYFMELPARTLRATAAPSDWDRRPFFYLDASWPSQFMSRPVFYKLPYVKGPPIQFISSITARWDAPEAELRIDGPQTLKASSDLLKLKTCFSQMSLECAKLRHAVLGRHLEEMKGRGLELEWIEVAGDPGESRPRVQGVHLRSEGSERTQDRYVLINAQGTQQALVLYRTQGTVGNQALKTLEQILASAVLRNSDEIRVERKFVDQAIERTQLAADSTQDPNAFALRLARVQSLLLAKVSVDPTAFEAWYHLGGTSLLLAKQAIALKSPEWSAIAVPMIQSASLYAKDILPTHPHTLELQTMLIEARRL